MILTEKILFTSTARPIYIWTVKFEKHEISVDVFDLFKQALEKVK